MRTEGIKIVNDDEKDEGPTVLRKTLPQLPQSVMRSAGSVDRGRAVRAVDAGACSLDAAALQGDIARRFNLPGAAVKRVKYLMATGSGGTNTTAGTQRGGDTLEQCLCCGQTLIPTETTCPNCGVFLRSLRTFEPSLSEIRGLVKSKVPETVPLSKPEWDFMEAKLFDRKESTCPICMEYFKSGHEVLLSCSHMFHRNCLSSFENFMKTNEKKCPICRAPNYQKKITHVGSKCYQVACAAHIQRIWRGYSAKCHMYPILREFYHQGHGLEHTRRRFYERELVDMSTAVSRDVDLLNSEVTSTLYSCDEAITQARELDALFNRMLADRCGMGASNSPGKDQRTDATQPKTSDSVPYQYALDDSASSEWRDIFTRARQRGFGDCAVCMCEVAPCCDASSKSVPSKDFRPLALLSCSHVFHDRCISSFEVFNKGDTKCCPVCRHAYDKTMLRMVAFVR